MELDNTTIENIETYVRKSSAVMSEQSTQIADLTSRNLALETKLAEAPKATVKTAAAFANSAQALISAGFLAEDDRNSWMSKAASDDMFVTNFITELAVKIATPVNFGGPGTHNWMKEAEAPRDPFEHIFFPGYSK